MVNKAALQELLAEILSDHNIEDAEEIAYDVVERLDEEGTFEVEED